VEKGLIRVMSFERNVHGRQVETGLHPKKERIKLSIRPPQILVGKKREELGSSYQVVGKLYK